MLEMDFWFSRFWGSKFFFPKNVLYVQFEKNHPKNWENQFPRFSCILFSSHFKTSLTTIGLEMQSRRFSEKNIFECFGDSPPGHEENWKKISYDFKENRYIQCILRRKWGNLGVKRNFGGAYKLENTQRKFNFSSPPLILASSCISC